MPVLQEARLAVMGLTATAKGLTDETGFDCGYITFGNFRIRLAETYDKKSGAAYKKWYFRGGGNFDAAGLDELEQRMMEELLNKPVGLFLFHSDCEGKMSAKECREVYEDIKDLEMDMVGHNYGVMKPYNMLEHWKSIFLHCARRRVNLYFR